jgi:hypothetical protein
MNTGLLQYMNGSTAEWLDNDRVIPSGFMGRDSTTGVCRIGTELPFSQSTLFFAPPIFRRLTSIFPSSSNVRANVPGAVFNCEAGRSYKIEINAIHQTAALTTGGSMGLVMPTGTGSIVGHQRSGISNLVVATETAAPLTAISSVSTLAGSFMSSPSVIAINTPHHWFVSAIFTCATAGSVQLQWGSEVNGSATQLNVGSSMLVTLLN